MDKEQIRYKNLRQRYGLTKADYLRLYADQAGKCAICEQAPKTVLYIDHSHLTGKVRGLVCCSCNYAMGYFRDRIDLLRRAIKYLREAQ